MLALEGLSYPTPSFPAKEDAPCRAVFQGGLLNAHVLSLSLQTIIFQTKYIFTKSLFSQT